MKLLRQAPFLRVVFFFILGILVAYYSQGILFSLCLTLFSLALVIFSSHPKLKNQYCLRPLFGVGLLCLSFFSGAYLFGRAWKTSEWEVGSKNYSYLLRILEDPSEKEKTYACTAEILSAEKEIIGQAHRKKVIVYLSKDSLSRNVQSGDAIRVCVRFDKPQHFSDEFDYTLYLRKKSIAAVGFVRKDSWNKEDVAIPVHKQLVFWSLKTRKILLQQLNRLLPEEDSFSLASALLLGYRNDLSEEFRQRFSHIGAGHILAISGLHFTILFGMLFYFLIDLGINSRYHFFLIPLIWGFAFLTGFSPSVNRAAWMMTVWIVGRAVFLPVFTFNTLSVAAFFMLLYSPLDLFDLGFQLSFLAVASILTLNPIFQSMYYSFNKLVQSVWELVAVSTAAQIGVMPLCIYYFHQFPLLFLVTNLLIIPLIYVLLFLIPVYMLFSFLFGISDGGFLNSIIRLFIDLITYLDAIPRGNISDIYISIPQTLCLYLCSVFGIYMFLKKRLVYGLFFLLSLIIYYLC